MTSTPLLTSTEGGAADTYGAGETIEFTVTFSEAVEVRGRPRYQFALADTRTDRRLADYAADAGTATALVFRYVVRPGDNTGVRGLFRLDGATAFEGIGPDGFDRIVTVSNGLDAALNYTDSGRESGHKVAGGAPVETATIATGGVRVTSTPALEDTYAAGETIEFTVTFTAPVTVTGDPEFEFSMTSARRAAFEATASTPTVLRFRYLVVETDEDTNGIWVGNQTRTLKLDDDDAIVTAFGGDPANLDHSGLGTLSGHKVDGDRVVTARIVNNGVRVTSTPTLGDTYVAGETIEFTVTFTAPVTVAGDPEFEFSLGNPGNNQARRAAYDATASTSTVLRFRYQVLATDEDSNGIWVRDQTRTFKLDADDAITTTSSGTDANLAHSQLGTLSGHKVDGDRVVTARIVNNGVRVTSTPTLGDTYVAGETIEFTVTFNVPVTVTGDPEFEFSMTSARRAAYDATASTPTVLRFRYLVQTTDEDTNGIWVGNQTRTLKLDADDAITTTSNGTDAVLDHGSLNTQSGHKVDGDRVVTARIVNNGVRVTSSPELRSSGSPVDDTYGRGATIEFTVTFTVPVTVTGDPEFEFSMTSARRAAYDAAASTPTVLRFRYLVVQADEDTNGIWVGNQTRTLKLDADDAITTTSDGTDAVLDHGSLNTQSGHKVDGDRVAPARVAPGGVRVTSTPTLMSPGSAVADTYAAGDAIEFTVTFTIAPVTVTGDPEFEFSMGDASRRAAYVAADSTATVLKFRYLVQVTDEDADGIWVGNQTRTLKLDADDAITTASPGSGHAILVHNPLGTLSGHKVDGTAGRMAPAAPSLTATPGDGQVTLAWTPNGDGGLPITGWYYRHAAGAAVPESVRWTGAAASPVTVPGLANDTQYAFEVAAVNTVGIGTPAVATATPTAPPACDMPSLSGRHVIWRAPLGVARLDRAPAGYGFDADVAAGRLPAAAFSVGPNRYAIAAVQVNDGGTGDGNLVVRLDGRSLRSADRARLTLHVCDTPYRFQDATPAPATHAYEWTASLDWSMTPDRELRLSLPTGNAATGMPVISGDSTKVGAKVRADTTAIVDLDGLPESFAYQWMRVDEDGTSNQANIEGATGAAYLVDAADAGKRLRVVVRFTDPFGMAETATSDPWPTVGTIMANEVPTSADATVTVAEDGMHAFTAADFAFTDGDADDTLAAVRIMAVPRAGRLALDGAPVRPDTLVTRARLDAAGLTYRPTANGNGAGYASFTFRVSDGDADSGAAYTLTLDVTPVNDAPTGRPVITVIGGTPRVGRPLSATPGNVADVDGLPGAFAWQWVQVDGTIETDIATATAETYSPVADDLGKTIKVKAVFTDGDGTRETVASAATGAVQAAVPDGGNATGRPTYVSGRPLEGSEVEFENGAVGDPDGLNRSRIRLEWLRCDSVGENCDTVIAVGDKYTLTAADVGLRLRVRAVFVDNGGNFESRTSFPWPPRNERQIRAYGRCTDADLEDLES